MTIFIWENADFLIGAPVTPVVRRDTIRAPVPAATASGTTVVMFVPPDKPNSGVPVDPKPWKVRA